MCKSERFISALPSVKLGRHGAALFYVSGEEEHRVRYPLDLWREFIGREATRLLEFDHSKRVLPFKR